MLTFLVISCLKFPKRLLDTVLFTSHSKLLCSDKLLMGYTPAVTALQERMQFYISASVCIVLWDLFRNAKELRLWTEVFLFMNNLAVTPLFHWQHNPEFNKWLKDSCYDICHNIGSWQPMPLHKFNTKRFVRVHLSQVQISISLPDLRSFPPF